MTFLTEQTTDLRRPFRELKMAIPGTRTCCLDLSLLDPGFLNGPSFMYIRALSCLFLPPSFRAKSERMYIETSYLIELKINKTEDEYQGFIKKFIFYWFYYFVYPFDFLPRSKKSPTF